MAENKALRRYDTETDANGLISIAVDVSSPDGTRLSRHLFHVTSAATECTMRAEELTALGYEAGDAVLPFMRIGAYDFMKLPVKATSDANVIGASVLKWLDFSISNSERWYEADLIQRLKQIVERGINPSLKPAYMSAVKPSEHNDNPNWYTWAELDRQFPDSWVLVQGTVDDPDYGGEVVWHSQTESPDATRKDTFIYCNKSPGTASALLMQREDSLRQRSYGKHDQEYGVFVEELECKLTRPLVDRFYYDTVSKQGRLFTMSKSSAETGANPNAVLTQLEIDALFQKMQTGDESVFTHP